jgi:hypothetical protein
MKVVQFVWRGEVQAFLPRIAALFALTTQGRWISTRAAFENVRLTVTPA